MQAKIMKKRIGLLTMHQVVNFGSVLQAYATQVAIKKMGYECELINYKYPNKIHNSDPASFLLKIIRLLMQVRFGFPGYKQRRAFSLFRERHLNQSREYPSRESLIADVPDYDTYVVGSDQTWNVRHIGCDDSFLLSFVPAGKHRISYASSAARKVLPKEYLETFKTNLSKFDAISVRESHTQVLVKSLIGKEVPITLDPTLLLDENDWKSIADTSKLKIKKPFILVYILKYSFSPYPTATDVIRKVYDQYHMPIVAIRYSARENIGIKDVIDLHEAIGPEDFVWLFMNASYVITTSFHGTVFSLNFKKPFFSIYDSRIEDDRIYSVLHLLGAESCGVDVSKEFNLSDAIDYERVSVALNSERLKSFVYLKNNL